MIHFFLFFFAIFPCQKKNAVAVKLDNGTTDVSIVIHCNILFLVKNLSSKLLSLYIRSL